MISTLTLLFYRIAYNVNMVGVNKKFIFFQFLIGLKHVSLVRFWKYWSCHVKAVKCFLVGFKNILCMALIAYEMQPSTGGASYVPIFLIHKNFFDSRYFWDLTIAYSNPDDKYSVLLKRKLVIAIFIYPLNIFASQFQNLNSFSYRSVAGEGQGAIARSRFSASSQMAHDGLNRHKKIR